MTVLSSLTSLGSAQSPTALLCALPLLIIIFLYFDCLCLIIFPLAGNAILVTHHLHHTHSVKWLLKTLWFWYTRFSLLQWHPSRFCSTCHRIGQQCLWYGLLVTIASSSYEMLSSILVIDTLNVGFHRGRASMVYKCCKEVPFKYF